MVGRRWLVEGSEMRIVARRRVMGRTGGEERLMILLEGAVDEEAVVVACWCGCGKEVCTGPICGMGLMTWAGMGASKV